MIMNTLDFFLGRGVQVWTIKDGFQLRDDITSKVISFAFGLAAEIERQLISERTKTALARAKQEGVHVGRPKGRMSVDRKLKPFDSYIAEQRKLGRTKASLAAEFGVCWDTMDAELRRLGIA